MTDVADAIPVVRASAVAVLRVHLAQPEKTEEGKVQPAQVTCSFGSGFCVVENRYVATAHHVLNGGKPRDPNDKFYVFVVPGNEAAAHHFPVTGFPMERPDLDLTVMEIGPCSTEGVSLPALPVALAPLPDGTPVITMGFPAPEIGQINIDQDLGYRGGQFFLKSHANEGIIAAQYLFDQGRMYELNVGWHHGESGGAIATTGSAPAVFSVMQHYRNVQSPYGIVAGPHRGFALSAIKDELLALGVSES